MSFSDKISSLLGNNKKPNKASSVKKSNLTKKADNKNKNTNKSKPTENLQNVIRQRERIPEFESVLSIKSGEISLTDPDVRKNFALILISKARHEVLLLEAIEGRENDKNHKFNFMDVRERARLKKYKVTTKLATRGIIQIIHENAEKISSEQDDDERASALQNDYDSLLKTAAELGVSDIHIEVRRGNAKIRFRRNGILSLFKEESVSYATELAGVIYGVIAEEKDVSFKPTEPQDAVIDRQLTDSLRMRVRLATMPAYPKGFDMVMRLLPIGAATSLKRLDSLGYTSEQVHDIKLAISRPVGATIISGTTGSGKSTTLVTILGRVIHEKNGTIKVITVEDPPEFEILGATQVPVVRSRKSTTRDGNPFSAAIRAAMRSDPDVLLIGETRDHDSCELLIHAVQSGHQVYTTIHAPSAIGIVGRLRSLGTPNDVLGSADFISGLVYQTLMPVLCPDCSYPMSEHVPVGEEKEEDFMALKKRISYVIEEDTDLEDYNIRMKGKGCENCDHGVIGRTVVAEICVPDHDMLSYFAQGRDTDAWHHWQDNGGSTALQTGIKKLLQGICDPFDAEHKLGLLTQEIVMKDRVFDYNAEREVFGYNEDKSSDKQNNKKESAPIDIKAVETTVSLKSFETNDKEHKIGSNTISINQGQKTEEKESIDEGISVELDDSLADPE